MKNLSTLTECLIPFIAKKVTTRWLWTNNLDNAPLKALIKDSEPSATPLHASVINEAARPARNILATATATRLS